MQSIRRKVRLNFIVPIMFDRYAGDNKTELPVEEKLYLTGNRQVIFPAVNLLSFLTGENTKSAPKILHDSREYKTITNALASFTTITPAEIPFLSDGKPVYFKGWNNQIQIHETVARLPKGIPNPKKRPIIFPPLSLEFELSYYENDVISESTLKLLFERGGIQVGLGTFRPTFGKFEVVLWK